MLSSVDAQDWPVQTSKTQIDSQTKNSGTKFGDEFQYVSEVFDRKVLKKANLKIDADRALMATPTFFDYFRPIAQRKSNVVDSAVSFVNNGNVNYQYPLAYNLNHIHFDSEGTITNQKDLLDQLTNKPIKELTELLINGIEHMAKQSGWFNRHVDFPLINIIRYPVFKDYDLGNLPWHRDIFGDTTMAVLMNSKVNEQGVGYTEGGLNTAKTAGKETVNMYGLVEWSHIPETKEKHSYQPNSGFLFTNCKGLLHQAAPIIRAPKRTSTEKSFRLLSIVYIFDRLTAAEPTNYSSLFPKKQPYAEKRLFSIFAETGRQIPASIGSRLIL